MQATKFCKISTVDLSYVVQQVKSTVEISKKFVAFSEYMSFILLKESSNQLRKQRFLISHNCIYQSGWKDLSFGIGC